MSSKTPLAQQRWAGLKSSEPEGIQIEWCKSTNLCRKGKKHAFPRKEMKATHISPSSLSLRWSNSLPFSSFHPLILPLFSVLHVIGEQPCLQITDLSFFYWVEITIAGFLIITSFVYLVISSNNHNSSRKEAFIGTHKSGRWHTNHLNFFYAVLLFFVRILSCVIWFEGIEIMANYHNGRVELKEQIHPKKKIHSLSSHPMLM